MKRFLIFAGHNYYPSGGKGDLKDDADTQEELDAKIDVYSKDYDWVDVIDTSARVRDVRW